MKIIINLTIMLILGLRSNSNTDYCEYFFSVKNYDKNFYSKPILKKRYLETPHFQYRYHIKNIEGDFIVTDCGYKNFYIHKDSILDIIKVCSKIETIRKDPCMYYTPIHTGGLRDTRKLELQEEVREWRYQIDTIIPVRIDSFVSNYNRLLKN